MREGKRQSYPGGPAITRGQWKGWREVGYVDEGEEIPATFRGYSADHVIVDELDAFRSIKLPETEAGRKAIEWDRYRRSFGEGL
jgi:hypothetical protein